jgi:rare lipoprotein A
VLLRVALEAVLVGFKWRGANAGKLVIVMAAGVISIACSRGQESNIPSARMASKPAEAAKVVDPKYGTSASTRVVAEGQTVPKGNGGYKIGKPYKIAGRWYTPAEDPNYDRQGRGSWYGTDFHGRKTANGEVFDMNALTAAHPTLPLPSYVYVTNLANNRTILVRVNDRGPYSNDRIIDMSRASSRALGFENQGITQVRVKFAGRAPLDGNDYHERQFLAQQGRGKLGPAMSLGMQSGGMQSGDAVHGVPPVTRPPRPFSEQMVMPRTFSSASPLVASDVFEQRN